MSVGHEVLSITAGRRSPGDNETWWWNDKMQEVIKAKKESMKVWETSVRQISTGRQANKEGKQGDNESSSTARAMNELYEELETPECERKTSRIAIEGQGFHQEHSDKERA